MPELPEVEVIKDYLEGILIDKQINKVNILNANLRYKIPKDITKIHGSKVISLQRQSKYLQIILDNGLALVIHLAISGRILVKNLDYQPIKHDHAIFYFDDFILVYNDARRFGVIDLIPQTEIKKHKLFSHLGTEPFNLTSKTLSQMLKKSKKPIKQFLMDNRYIVGIGNIYANEILFYGKINPHFKSCELSEDQTITLQQQIKQVLRRSIELGGSSIRDFVNPAGIKGKFAENFAVYGRHNMPCNLCQTPIQRTKIQGRSTFFCPLCQSTYNLNI